jgi:DNA invertase Pin-like site-specific DNA recombinase
MNDIRVLRSICGGVPIGCRFTFMLTQMAAVAELEGKRKPTPTFRLEAGLISQRTRAALAQAKVRGVKLGNPQLKAGTPDAARKAAAAQRAKAQAKATDVLPLIRQAQATGASTLQSIADAMTARDIPTPGARGGWYPSTVSRLLSAA